MGGATGGGGGGVECEFDGNQILQSKSYKNKKRFKRNKEETHAIGCAGLPPLHVVWTLISINDCGGPLDVNVGVNEGSQKSGSLCFNASACSFSICATAASSASWARDSTVDEENSNLRLVPLPFVWFVS